MKIVPQALEGQLQEVTFEFALNLLIDEELDMSALDVKLKNDGTRATAYDPRVILKIMLLAYTRGPIGSRTIEKACEPSVLFMAMSCGMRPIYTHIVNFVKELKDNIQPLFARVLLHCDQLGLIGRGHFAIDRVKLPSNASKERSGNYAELLQRATMLDKAAQRIIQTHRDKDEGKGSRIWMQSARSNLTGFAGRLRRCESSLLGTSPE